MGIPACLLAEAAQASGAPRWWAALGVRERLLAMLREEKFVLIDDFLPEALWKDFGSQSFAKVPNFPLARPTMFH